MCVRRSLPEGRRKDDAPEDIILYRISPKVRPQFVAGELGGADELSEGTNFGNAVLFSFRFF